MKILAIAVHPDDETLGCGGTLLKHKAGGDEIHWIVVTRIGSPNWSEDLVQKKAREIDAVAKAYEFASVSGLGHPAAELESVPIGELIRSIRGVIADIGPDIVYTVHGGDVHSDHRLVFESISAVLKPLYMRELGVRRLLSFETISSTDAAPPNAQSAFLPQVLVDVSEHLSRKLEIMNMYESELQSDFAPRSTSSIEALARYRGSMIGAKYAEAFSVIREIG